MPLKVEFEYIVCITIYVIGKDVGQYFPNILSGNKDFTNKIILNTNTLDFERAFLLIHICRCLYFITFYLKNRHFCPPKCPRDKKGQKNYVPRVSGAQTRDKIEFLHFAYYNCKIVLSDCYSVC